MLKFVCAKCGGMCHPDEVDLVINNGGIFYATCEDCGVPQGISCDIEPWYKMTESNLMSKQYMQFVGGFTGGGSNGKMGW